MSSLSSIHLPTINRSTAHPVLRVLLWFILPGCILLVYIAGNLLQRHTGMGDNGDFSRVMGWFTSGPLGFSQNWPTGSYEFNLRFFNYWLPYWNLDYPMKFQLLSSAILLWAPGVWINRLFYSPTTLYLFYMSLPARLLGLVFIILVFRWLRRHRFAPLLFVTIGLPLALMLITTGYNAYFNTFYQETASLVFFLYLVAALIYLHGKPLTVSGFGIGFAAIFLFSTAKVSNLYWPALTLPFYFPLTKWLKKPLLFAGLAIFWIAIPTYVSFQYVAPRHLDQQNRFHSIFYGVLSFSSDPQLRLAELGINDGIDCINTPAFTEVGVNCLARYSKVIAYTTTAKILLREPSILWNQLLYAANAMQNLNVVGYVKYALDDQRNHHNWLLEIWQNLKARFFPQGTALVAAFITCPAIFFLGLRARDLRFQLSLVGLLSTLGCVIDIFVEFAGNGKADLFKHLFLSSLLFDVLLIAAVNILLISALQAVSTYRASRI